MRANGGAGGRPKSDIGHEMPIHHINMHPIRTLSLNRAAFRTEIGKISRQDSVSNRNAKEFLC
jgi:hypothetical protein